MYTRKQFWAACISFFFASVSGLCGCSNENAAQSEEPADENARPFVERRPSTTRALSPPPGSADESQMQRGYYSEAAQPPAPAEPMAEKITRQNVATPIERRLSDTSALPSIAGSADELRAPGNHAHATLPLPSPPVPSLPEEIAAHDSGEAEPPVASPASPPPDEPGDIILTSFRATALPAWRASVKPRGCAGCDVVTQVQQRKGYALSIRLTNDRTSVDGGETTESMIEVLKEIPEHGSIPLKLVPLFVDGLMPLDGENAKPMLMEIREPDATGDWGRADIEFAVRPNAKKCASLILSVWDVTLTMAYDAILVTFPVGRPTDASRCPDPLHRETPLFGVSLVSLSDAFQPPVASVATETTDRISLYAFELPIMRNSYVFAVIDPAYGETSVSGWKLRMPLSESFGEQALEFNRAAQRDRERMNGADDTEWIYKETAKFIKKKLFTAETTSGGEKPEQVFERMRTLINRDGADPNVMAQIFVPIPGSDESGLMFLPLRTLAAANSYFRDFRFTSPLPGSREESVETTACISTWRLVLNTGLADSTGGDVIAQSRAQAAIERLAALEPKPWRPSTMTSNEEIRDFFEKQHDAEDQAGSTGIIIASHYGRKTLALDDGEVIGIEDMIASRAPHSVAVLAACETAAPGEANGIIRSLREQNVDAFLASPLKVPTDYAIRLVESLVEQIDLAYETGAEPTLAELYAASMDNVEIPSEGQRIEVRNLGREFVTVGDSSRRLCKHPSTGEDGNGQDTNP